MQRGNGIGIAHAQFEELRRLVAIPLAVGLVDHQQHGRVGFAVHDFLVAAQDLGHFLVGRRDAADGVNDEQDNIRILNGDLGLGADLLDKIG